MKWNWRCRGGQLSAPTVLIVLSLFSVPAAQAATYYIDYASGNDSNNGTSKSTPWQRAPGMPGCASSCNSTTPQPGDRFLFKGGVTWDHTALQWNITWSGTSGNPIYFGVDQTWYAGASWTRPIISGDHANLASGSSLISISNQNYVTIDNFEFKGLTAFANFGVGSIAEYCDTYLTLSNLYIHDWALDSSVTSDDAHGGIIGNYPGCSPQTNTINSAVISNVEAASAGRQNGVAIRAAGTIKNTTIHDVSSAVLFALDYNGNTMYNVSYPSQNLSFDPTYHCNGVYLDPATLSGTTGYIRNSTFHDVSGGANMAYPNVRGGASVYVNNNLFYGQISVQDPIEIDPYQYSHEGPGNCYVYNNTVYLASSAQTVAARVVDRGTSQKVNVLEARNNHVIGTGVLVDDASSSDVTTLNQSNNLIQTASVASGQGYTQANLWQPTSATDSTIGAGFDESAIFTTDKLGVTRPPGAWDIGAYQFAGGASGPAANVYIAQSVAGTADGSSCANAKAVSFFNTAANWGTGAGQIGPGTTAHLCGTISTSLVAQGSGSAGNPITILFEVGAKLSKSAWGTGSSSAFYSSGKTDLVIDGNNVGIVESTNNGTALGMQQDAYGLDLESCDNCEAKNLTIQNMYVRTASGSDSNQYGTDIYLDGGNNIKVHNNTLNNAFNSINVGILAGATTTGSQIYSNTITNVSNSINFGSDGNDAISTNAKVYGNDITHTSAWTGSWTPPPRRRASPQQRRRTLFCRSQRSLIYWFTNL